MHGRLYALNPLLSTVHLYRSNQPASVDAPNSCRLVAVCTASRRGADWPRHDTNVSESYAVKPLIPKSVFSATFLVRVAVIAKL